jgi:hypothetical protein
MRFPAYAFSHDAIGDLVHVSPSHELGRICACGERVPWNRGVASLDFSLQPRPVERLFSPVLRLGREYQEIQGVSKWPSILRQ